MATRREVQLAMLARGISIGPSGADGVIGPDSLQGMMDALLRIPVITTPPSVSGPIPAAWLTPARMKRLIVHWTAGSYNANGLDKASYHVLVEGDAKLVRGTKTIKDNESSADGVYAAHTKNCNTGSVGISACSMGGPDVKERPFNGGQWPLKRNQWEMLIACSEQICRFYGIPITEDTLLTHAEVQTNLGIQQNGKWDIAILPFNQNFNTAREVGNELRRRIFSALR